MENVSSKKDEICPQEKISRIALSLTEGIGDKKRKKLIEYFKSAEAVFQASKSDLAMMNLMEDSILSVLHKRCMSRAEMEYEFIRRNEILMISWGDDNYPKILADARDAPFLFFYKGADVLQGERIISVVGTRNASSYGRRACRELVEQLAPYRPLVVSGLAYGIDCYAHQAAIDNEISTVAVLGHGLDMIYPSAHTKLAHKMLESGGLLSEFPSQTIPDRFNFPMRNRIIAGLAHLTIVVEAGEKGGALITANIANSYDRDVGAVPGGIFDDFSIGCNRLIKTQYATMIRSATDVEELMQWKPLTGLFSRKSPKVDAPSAQETEIKQFLHENGPATMDRLAEGSGLNLSTLSLILLEMEIKEMITALPGKIYINR